MRRGFIFAVLLTLLPATLRAETVALRIRFGMKDTDEIHWDGSITPSQGKVDSIRGWRWMTGDKAEGNSFTVMTRRQQRQGRSDQGRNMPMTDNGILVTLSGVDDTAKITFDSKQGKTSFKLADVPYGKPMLAMDKNLRVDRVPASSELANAIVDEDYPCVATGKNGEIYVAYLAFAHGKDFVGPRERPATPESGPTADVLNTTNVKKIEKPEDLDYLAEPTGGEQIYLRVLKDSKWTEPIAVTDGKQELYRPAIAVDGGGHVWVFYSAHVDADKNLDHGNWELMATRIDLDGKAVIAQTINISNSPGVDFMPAATTDSDGKAWVTWVGGRESNFNVFVAHQDGEKFSAQHRLTNSTANEWEPSIAADAKGNLAVAWDTYAKGDYDVQLSLRDKDGHFGAIQDVAATLAFEVRPSLAYDPQGKLWIAYETSGDQWGKDFGALKKKGIPLYEAQNAGGRGLGIKVLDADGKWFSPPDVMDAIPDPGVGAHGGGKKNPATQPAGVTRNIAPCFPRIASGANGEIWLSYRGRPGGNWRVGVGSVWCEYFTHLGGDEAWSYSAWIPRSNNVLDNRPALTADKDRLMIVYSGDGRGEMNPPKVGDPHLAGVAEGEMPLDPQVAAGDDPPTTHAVDAATGDKPRQRGQRRGGGKKNLDAINQDIFVTFVRSADFAATGEPKLKGVGTPAPATPIHDTQDERDAVKTIRDYRIEANGESLRIWRGEFHRHTEFSPDGGGDGGLLDMWRYAIDACALDWIGDGDHDYGSGREYSWWTTQKAVTLFTIPNHFVPMYCYERSVSYPEGHRNCMFAQRGVRSLPRLPITSPDEEKSAPDTQLCYMYLHHFNGVCASHTSATGMGTDWRDNDPQVEPFVEIYQGDRNNYERPDSPRSAVTEAKLKQSTPEKESLGGWEPKGFVNLALLKGYRLAFQSSSDHISTHLSYCNVLIPGDKEPTREAVIEAVKKRRVYGATDNIVADVRCTAGGKEHLMGEEFSTNTSPTLKIHFIGEKKIAKVTIIKDDEEVHVAKPNEKDVSLTWTDPNPTPGKTSYYYVRGEQAPDMDGVSSGELVWASPMWIKFEK